MFSSTVWICTLTVFLSVFQEVQSFKCICTNATNYAPVCASDGRTYSNSKLLYCYNVCNAKNLQIVAYRPCSAPAPIPQNNCNNCLTLTGTVPVCGTDGTYYPSIQSLNCAKSCRNQNLQVLVTGYCPTNTCSCSYLGGNFPVCGSDGRSYRNSEVLTCLNRCQATNTQIVRVSACANHNWMNQQTLHFS